MHNRPLTRVVKAAIEGGATIIQLRDKHSTTVELLRLGKSIHVITKKFGIPLIINDRLDIALALDAEGVHLGQADMPVKIARKILGNKKIVGISVKTVEEALLAQKDGADYLGVGPIFTTKSKHDAGKAIGLTNLAKITQAVSLPVVGIGGITTKNAKAVIQARACGIAVISAVMAAKDPMRQTAKLRSIIDEHG